MSVLIKFSALYVNFSQWFIVTIEDASWKGSKNLEMGKIGYWRDLRKEPQYFSSRNFGEGSLMVWHGFCASGKLNLVFTSFRMNSRVYIQLEGSTLIPFKNKYHHKRFVFNKTMLESMLVQRQ